MKHILQFMIITLLLSTHTAVLTSTNTSYTTSSTFEMLQKKASTGDFSDFFPLIYQNKITPENINNLDQKNATLLYWAVLYNKNSIVETLLNMGAAGILTPQTNNDEKPLETAIKNKNLENIQLLLDAQLIEDRTTLLDSINPKSSNADAALINKITTAPSNISQLFKNIKKTFECDQEENKDSVTITSLHPNNDQATEMYCFMLNSSLCAVQTTSQVIAV
mgnify:CR=1 FL=1